MSSISTISQLAQTYAPAMLVEITSLEDGTQLFLSQMPITYSGNTYLARIISASGFDVSLESAPLGIMAIPDITFVLGDVSGGSSGEGDMSSWDNTHYFKGASITVSLVFYNPTTKTAQSSNSMIVFKGICNAPDQVTPTTLTLSAYSRFNAEFLLVPTDRVSIFCQNQFPGDGAQDSDDANSSSPASVLSAGYQLLKGGTTTSGGYPIPIGSPQDYFLPYFPCGYGPLRGSSGWAGSNPIGNLIVTNTTANIFSSTTIGNSSASFSDMTSHLLAIVSGTGAGQVRRIRSNTATTITVANRFTTTPDGTSVFAVLYGFCGKANTDCVARGMYTSDLSSRDTSRFRGFSYVPIVINQAKITVNPDTAKFNQPIPLLYGSGITTPFELFSVTGYFNAQYTHAVYLVGLGPLQSLSNFIVGGTIVPYVSQAEYNSNISSVPSSGHWTYQLGLLGQNFINAEFQQDDTHGLAAMIFARFPPQFLSNVPGGAQMQVQYQGLPLYTCDGSGNMSSAPQAGSESQNPAWIILDVLLRSGWKLTELNLPSFYAFSVYADQPININVSSTQTTSSPRFALSAPIIQQQPASEVLRQILGASHGILSYDQNGLLSLNCENRLPNTTLGASVGVGTNWVTVEDGAGITIGSVLTVGNSPFVETVTVTGVRLSGADFQFQATFTLFHGLTNAAVVAAPAFSFSLSSIALGSGSPEVPSLTRSSLKTRETPNEFTTQFQDSMRAFVTDTVNLMNTFEANAFGAPVIGQLNAIGFTTVDAATRISQLQLFKAHGRRDTNNAILSRGNLFATLTSSVKSINATCGSICYLTYPKEGWTNKPFRVTSVSPVADAQFPFWKIKVTLREHDDSWYDVINGNIAPPPSFILPPPPPGMPAPRPVGPRPAPFRPILQ